MLKYNPTISFDEQGIYNGRYHELALLGIQEREEKQAELIPETGSVASEVPRTYTNEVRLLQSPEKDQTFLRLPIL